MPRAVPNDLKRRRRDRLAELIDALGQARGERMTQREFAASIGREQGTIAAILGGDRALGGEVMMAVVQAYRLPAEYFDSPLRPDPRTFARAMFSNTAGGRSNVRGDGLTAPAMSPMAQGEVPPVEPPRPRPVPSVGADHALTEVLAALAPDRAVSMALEALARRGVRDDIDGWTRLAIGAQSAHDHGVLVDWYDRTVAAHAEAPAEGLFVAAPRSSEGGAGVRRVAGR